LTASVATASPVITSISPDEGSVSGGTTVVIRGSGFSNICTVCLPPSTGPLVYFGTTPALFVEFIDETELHGVTPPQFPGRVFVRVVQYDGSTPNDFTLLDAFTYVGDIEDGFDPILFPIFSPPVQGRGGTEFRTTARLWNKGVTAVPIYGVDLTCTTIDPPIDPSVAFLVHPRGFETELIPDCSHTAGRLFYVPKHKIIAASLRVSEKTRRSEDHGVEIPVVRRDDFAEDSIALLGVPNDPKFRLTLRIYGLDRGPDFVNVFVLRNGGQGGNLYRLPLQHSNSPFEPSYAIFTDFPPRATTNEEELTVLVEVPRDNGGEVIPGTPIWAFITVTNNDTQHITTVTPQQE
jgi:hypothetical protein